MEILDLRNKVLNIFTLDITEGLNHRQRDLLDNYSNKYHYYYKGKHYLLVSEEYLVGWFFGKKKREKLLANLNQKRRFLKGQDLIFAKDWIILSNSHLGKHLPFSKQLDCFLTNENPLKLGLYPERIKVTNFRSKDVLLIYYNEHENLDEYKKIMKYKKKDINLYVDYYFIFENNEEIKEDE